MPTKNTPLSWIIVIFSTLFLMTELAYAAPITSLDDAINKAGRQRMLTQRITKSYFLIGQDVAVDSALSQLDGAVALFEEQLLELEEFSPNGDIAQALATVRASWQTFRTDALSTPEKDQALLFLSTANDLLARCEIVVGLLEAEAKTQKGKIINISGRQRMLSQRIAMLYAAHAWGVGNDNTAAALQTAVAEFDTALAMLQGSGINTPDIQKALKKVNAQWRFSRSGFALMDSDQYVPHVIHVTTESILKKMDRITGMYSQ